MSTTDVTYIILGLCTLIAALTIYFTFIRKAQNTSDNAGH
jgi:uncharacterized membrane protein YuzA (DUF378 family)